SPRDVYAGRRDVDARGRESPLREAIGKPAVATTIVECFGRGRPSPAVDDAHQLDVEIDLVVRRLGIAVAIIPTGIGTCHTVECPLRPRSCFSGELWSGAPLMQCGLQPAARTPSA